MTRQGQLCRVLQEVTYPCRLSFTAGLTYHEVPVVTVWLEDKPGTAAKTAKKLADAGVNIELFAPVQYTDGKATIAIGVDKIEDARRVLSDQLTEWTVAEPMPAGVAH